MPATPKRKTKISNNRIADDSRGRACITRVDVISYFSDAAVNLTLAMS